LISFALVAHAGSKKKGRGSKEAVKPPPKPNFVHATELTGETFSDLVRNPVNESGISQALPYYPIVLFHVSWCTHCKHTLPEFEQAAQTLSEVAAAGQLKGFQTMPRFFLIECDQSGNATAECEKYTRGGFPVIKLFRHKREMLFNRPRIAQNIAWWATRMSRPALTEVSTKAELEGMKQRGSVFLLHAAASHSGLVQEWMQVALDFLEEHHFAVVRPTAQIASGLEPAPSVTVRGIDLEPLPFEGAMTRESLSTWVNFNQWSLLVELDTHIGYALQSSGVTVVVLALESGTEGMEAKSEFAVHAKELHTTGKFVFACANLSDPMVGDFIGHHFPLVTSTSLPSAFVFSGAVYWERPQFLFPGVTEGKIEVLLADSEARQDDTWPSWVKSRKKFLLRFAFGSVLGFSIISASLAMTCMCCYCCFSALTEEDEHASKLE